jgi:aspartokinase-like uncharacterized kinase
MEEHRDRAHSVVKVGGSLFNWPELGDRLRLWLRSLGRRGVLLLPGGGPTADVIREFDRCHGLGEERAHWLALRALALNASFLQELLPSAAVIRSPTEGVACWRRGVLPILDAEAFCRADELHPGCLPHHWSITSDSIAARVARVAGAGRLVLLKSTDLPPGISWREAGQRGMVDPWFGEAVGDALEVECVNLRRWQPS